MIQRKQTIFLALALIFTICCLCMPLGMFESSKMGDDSILYNLWVVSANGEKSFGVWPLFFILVISCPINIFAIISYNNRMLQSKMCVANVVLMVVWYVMLFLFSQKAVAGAEFHVSMASAFPLVAIVLYFMARHGIIADEKLVRAADRIR